MRSLPLPREGVSRIGRRNRWGPIADALRASLANGSRLPGELLPSTRDLAATFRVHRQTIMVALDALSAEGLLRAEPRRGYRVAPPEPQIAPVTRRAARRSEFHFRVRRAAQPYLPELTRVKYPLHAATPDPELLPWKELRASYAHVLGKPGAVELGEANEWGHPALCRELSGYLRRARAVAAEPLLLTLGSQEGISLVAQTLLGPGDAVAVEDPGYPPAWEAFRAAGAQIVPIPVDAQGLRVDLLARQLERQPVRLVYVTPNHQYPTTVTLSGPRRRALLELTLARGVPILEDDYDHEYHFRGMPQAPLASSVAAPHVLYVASMSKLLAPGIRIGMLCGPAELLRTVAERRRFGVRGGDAVTQAALADWIMDGGFEKHLRRARRAYAERREAALDTLARAAREVALELTPPDGGLAIWTVWPDLPVAVLAQRALARGVSVLPGSLVTSAGTSQGMRLAYARASASEFAAGVAILVQEAKALARPRGARRR